VGELKMPDFVDFSFAIRKYVCLLLVHFACESLNYIGVIIIYNLSYFIVFEIFFIRIDQVCKFSI